MSITIVGRSQPPCPQCEMAKNICISQNVDYAYIELTAELLESYQNMYPNLQRTLPIIIIGRDYIGSTNDLKKFLQNEQKDSMICENSFSGMTL